MTALGWLFLNFISIIMLAFYSMLEMACVSFNKVKLHYYLSIGDKRAIWLNYLLTHPFRLFGTTLIGVNIATVVGSEFARQFHSAIGISPDLAPISQVFLVVLFGELAPMFAARHYAENVAMLGVPIVYASSKVMAPILWVIGIMTRLINSLFKSPKHEGNIFLDQEELQKILEDHPQSTDGDDINVIATNIFALKQKEALQVLTPIRMVAHLPSNATVAQMRNAVSKTGASFILIYHKEHSQIVAIAHSRDMVRAGDSKRVRDFSRQPWFVTQHTSMMQILHQFRRNNESVAVILNDQGRAIGIITLDDVVRQLFGKGSKRVAIERDTIVIDRTFPGTLTVKEFNRKFHVKLHDNGKLTLSQLMAQELGRHPEEGESVILDSFELIAKETSLLEVRQVTVKKGTR